ncbi:MAG: HAD hydrolase-like protein [Thermodesulfobacteriota bacterium]
MHLVLFDLDGTLTATNHVDMHCFMQTARDLWGDVPIDTDWRHYSDTTDQAIVADLVQRLGRDGDPEHAIAAFKTAFMGHLSRAAADPSRFAEIPGAGKMLAALGQHPEFAFGIATGAWRDSAALKLELASLDPGRAPLVTSDEAFTRVGIMEMAANYARKIYGRDFSKTTYVGDGPWDLLAARTLGYGFVGVATGDRAAYFQKKAAGPVVADYRDTEGFLDLFR